MIFFLIFKKGWEDDDEPVKLAVSDKGKPNFMNAGKSE